MRKKKRRTIQNTNMGILVDTDWISIGAIVNKILFGLILLIISYWLYRDYFKKKEKAVVW